MKIWDLKSRNQKEDPTKNLIKYGFIVFKMTKQNTQSEQQKLEPSKL